MIVNNFDKFQFLRKEHPVMAYDSYSYEIFEGYLELRFKFSLSESIFFEPSIKIPQKEFRFFNIDKLDTIVFNIGMIELISYWKLTCSPKIIVKAGYLDKTQKKWWEKLIYNGLGEFMYVNSINVEQRDFVQIECGDVKSFDKVHTVKEFPDVNGNILPIGGGKDSIVTMELLKNLQNENVCMMINPKAHAIQGVEIAGYYKSQVFEIYREMDSKLFEFNKLGYLNGHTPFSAVVGFYGILAGILLNKENIVLSNESSANESTVTGSFVNHQYSKTYEYEKDFSDYVTQYITPSIKYFSLLRGYSELRIAQIFSKYPKYFSAFRSCNVGSRVKIGEEESWCASCPKCLFVFIILASFIDYQEIVNIFGKNMLNDKDMLKYFIELVGEVDVKPFECVGTRDEVNMALRLIMDKFDQNGIEYPYLIRYYKAGLDYLQKTKEDVDNYLNVFNNVNNIPKQFLKYVKEEYEEYYKLLGKEVCVTVDRPLGTTHPSNSDLVYEVNYGYIENVDGGDGEFQDAYVVGVNEPVENFTGEIIAVVLRNDDVETKWVVAPKGTVMYQPEIRKLLDFQEKYFDTKYICKYEKACGGVLYIKTENDVKFVLIQNITGWIGFPKGHIEYGETEIETASREIVEEIGVKPFLYKSFKKSQSYSPHRNVDKKVIYFLGKLQYDQEIKLENEINKYWIVSYEEALKLLTYEGDREILEKFQKIVNK